MKLLIDTNVIIYYILKDETHYDECKSIIERTIDNDDFELISASAATDIFYIINKQIKDSRRTQATIQDLLKIVHIASTTENDILYALELSWNDFEDAVQYSVALSNGADYIISYNKKDYSNSKIPVFTPSEFLNFKIE